MAFLKVGKEPPKKKQRLYLMRITFKSGLTVIKIGKASGASSKERMLQIAASIYDIDRTLPHITVKRDQVVDAELVFKYETILHKYFCNYQYKNDRRKPFDGITETFVIPESDAIQAFEAVLAGLEPEECYVMPEAVEEDCVSF